MSESIWFDREAQCWEEALPIGNGRLGAMIFGGVGTENIQMNEDSIWYGGKRDRVNPDARENLNRVRELILNGKPDEAEEVLRYTFSGTPQSQRIYQPLADCTVSMKGAERAVYYERRLDLEEGVVKIAYTTARGWIRREAFSSDKHQVIAYRMEAGDGESLSFDILLTRQNCCDEVVLNRADSVILTGNLGKGGLDFAAGCRVCAEGGSVQRLGEHLVVRDAKTVIIYLTGTSTFYESELLTALEERLEKAAAMSYEALRREHVENYRGLFGRVELTLPTTEEKEELTTPERLKRVKQGEPDPGLAKLYFDFGRYLLISSSRKGSLPATLQGIWNNKMQPHWESKYTININTEMNYWPAESCGLQECMEPIFSLLERLKENGEKTARSMYGCRGFVVHHNTDIWADTAPQDIYIPATYWPMGGAWLSLFIWRHYEYTQDREWLEHYFPILKEATQFFLDYLVEDGGEYVTCPSVSPENTYRMENGVEARVCAGPAMDNEILADLFEACVSAAAVLEEEDDGWVEQVKAFKEKLPPIQVGKYGQIMEWREDYEETEPGHRHISQLYALYPSGRITPDETPELARAAEKTLERRLQYGGGHTGWSCAWIINFYAQLGKGEEALKMLKSLFVQSTFDNLMDNHPAIPSPVFQIDGNLGGCDAILQMLVQDNGKRVLLLPACPKEWAAGRMNGVCLKGNARLSFSWTSVGIEGEVEALSDWEGTLVHGAERQKMSLKKGCRERFIF